MNCVKSPFDTGDAVDDERPHLDLVRDELVVVRPRLVRRAEDERAAVDLDLVGPGRRAIRGPRVPHGIPGLRPELERLEHRLLVLQLVLEHEPEDEALAEERVRDVEVDVVERGEHTLAHIRGVGAGCGRAQGGKLRPLGPLVPERVVDVVVGLRERWLAVEVPQEPELLEVRDMGEVPHERRVERGDLGGELRVGDRLEQRLRGRAGALEGGADLDPRVHVVTVGAAAVHFANANRGSV